MSGAPLRFGVFHAPFHKVGINPTLALERDLQLAELLDSLGYDEIWFGEHHSSGIEISASPEIMVAAAAQRTRYIKLGTGVISLPFHNPFTTADRLVQLSHLTRGRLLFGAGPGQLAQDFRMLGLDPAKLRPRMEESLDVILRLLDGQSVTETSEWYELHDARLQLKPFADLEVAVTGAISPNGPKLAGKYGASLLSLAATEPAGVALLADHWSIVEAEAARHGRTVSRDNWRLAGRMHIAETADQAKREAEYGLEFFDEYLTTTNPGGKESFATPGEYVDYINRAGRGVFGTPDMAIDYLRRLIDTSGGFGTFLFAAADYVRWDAQQRSYQLIAEEVIPALNGQLEPLRAAYESAMAVGTAGADVTARAQSEARERYQRERSGTAPAGTPAS